MDLASIVGLVVGMVLIVFSIVFNETTFGLDFANMSAFIHFPSAIITFGGTITCLITMSKGFGGFLNSLKSIGLAFKVRNFDEEATIKQIIELSNIARKEGLLSLEEVAGSIDDDFIKKGILLIVDGTDPELVSGILQTELEAIEGRHSRIIQFWTDMAAMGPAWGMIGTLIGLINMLKSLDDPSSIGPSMSVALITTLYGSLLANWLATPIATKLKDNSQKELTTKEVMVEGLLSIQAGENPRVIEEKLKSYLSPDDRKNIGEQEPERD